ncbi:RHS repeat-associated core domain-containing protein [Pseudomonas sp. YNh]|uniref:RHS repeat domain-containing protein n=1 Tax=Pseudomonas sp. YNh TaxID=3133145 RepID=UPI0030F021B8
MATTSNAFNFSSFMQSSVDPRTGLYTLSIDLPALNANDLCGPDLPLQLNFSPMSNENYGFGIGWRLKLSSFNITTGMLSLHTGESFKVADNGPGNAPVIAEKKIDSFHFTNISAGTKKRIRIAHKSGLIEILEPQEKDPETALPVRVMGASGHGVNLAYDTTEAKPRLKSITDDTKHILLEIKYPTNNRTEFTFNPTTRSAARYTLDLVNNELRKVTLPTSSDEYWELHYKLYDRFPFLSKVENPDKGVEEITYHEGKTGHKYPGIDRYLPAVKAHLIMPDVPDTTTHILTEYTYSNNNFLGNGTGLTYGEENGTDQLYRFTGHTFEYNSTAKHFRDKKEYRTVVSTFNRFHLMTSQATTDDGCIETITTTYNELENLEFKYQPNHFQLPLTVRKSWAKAGDPTVGDYEETKTTYDIHGNLLTELKPDGTSMRRTYYPGMDDPEGFERNLKFMVIYPATPSSPDEPLAQLISSEFTYASLPALPQNNPDLNMPEWLLLEKEDIFEGEGEARQLLNSKIRRYLNKVDTPFQHGRVDQQITQINDATTTSDWKYEKVKDGNDQLTWSRSTETFTDHTHTLEKKTATTYSMHNGQVVLEHDANNVFTHYEHDVLGRVIAETASPGTPYATTRTTAYKLLDESGRKRTCEETTDSKGVVTRTVFDGSRRPIREEREAKDAVTGVVVKRTVAEFNYDSAGRLVSEIGYDYLPDKDGKPEPRVLKLESKYKYDGWGQQCEEERPDGIKERIDATPLEPGGQLITRWTESPNAPGHRLQQTVSKLNRFSKPVYECRLLEEEVKAPDESTHRVTREAGRTDFTYDGVGRCVSRTESILDPRGGNQIIKRTSKFTYDALGRMTSNQRPDGTTLLRKFAPHSMGELVTELQLKENSNAAEQMLYERKFDGLGRLVRMTVGLRVEEYSYQGTTQLVDKRTAFSLDPTSLRKRVIGYEYKQELTEHPSKLVATLEDEDGLARQGEQLAADFEYDGESAEITHANNAQGKRGYVYTDQGDLCEEHLTDTEGTPYSVTYQQSWQGLPTQRKHSDGQACDYDYDGQGRLVSVVQGNLKSTLTYSEDTGLLETTETRDTTNPDAQQQPVTLCTQHNDSLGRETRRTLSVNGQVRQLVNVWLDNDMLHSRTLWQGEQKLREETFEYDDLGRLTKYDCPVQTTSGRQIKTQIFRFDAVDNVKRCRTTFNEGDPDDAEFTYCAHDSFRLKKVTHTVPPEGCPLEQTFSYDELGNMLNDECGNALYYDSLGRLHQVQDANRKVTAQYGYDGHDQLLYSGTDARKIQRRYLDHSLDSILEDGLLTEYLRAGGQPRAQQQAGSATLLLTDHAGSVNTEHDADGTRHAHYAPYGEQQPEDAEQPLRSLLAFNGEARERALGWYLLGSGYRAYNPGLMRFHSPDSMPPEEAGINPYVYALGNPVYWHDPTGHRGEPVTRGRQAPLERRTEATPKVPWYAWLGVAALAAIFVVGAYMAPWSIPAAISAVANLAATVLGGVATSYMYKNPELANMLQNFATVFSVIGMFAAGYGAATTRAAGAAAKGAQGPAAKGAQAAPPTTKAGGQIIENRIYNFIQKPSGRIVPRRARASIRTITEPGPSSASGTSSASTPTTSSSAASTSAQASTSTVLSPSVVSRPTGAPPPHGFKLDLSLLSESNRFVLRRGANGSYFTAPLLP